MAATMVEQRPMMTRPLPTGRVCRSLFGPVDHEETNRVLQREVARVKEEYRRKWNFDFDTDTPLPGLYDWHVETPTPLASTAFGGGVRSGVVVPRMAAPVALRLTIKHHQAASLSSEGEEDETEPETPGSSRGSSDESDCDLESPLDRCIRQHNYDLRSIHPASTPSSTPSTVAASSVASGQTSTTSSASSPSSASSQTSLSSSVQHRLSVALHSPGQDIDNGDASSSSSCPPVTLEPIVEGCRSPVDPNSPSQQPRQTKITDFLRQRKRKLSAADSLNKKILRGSPFRGVSAAAAAAPAAVAAAPPGLGFEAASTGPSVQ